MTLTVEVSEDVGAGLTLEARARGVELSALAASILGAALKARTPTSKPRLTPPEIRAWLDSVAEFSEHMPDMPGETFSREMLYAEHD